MFGMFGSIAFLFLALMLVDIRAVALAVGLPASLSPVYSMPGSCSIPPGSLPWFTPFTCEGASIFVSGFPTLKCPIRCLLVSGPSRVPISFLTGETLGFSTNALGTPPQILEEQPYLLPDFLPTRKASPARPDETYKAVALVHRDQEVLPRSPRPVYQERLHVPLHPLQYRVGPLQILPGAQPQERLSG